MGDPASPSDSRRRRALTGLSLHEVEALYGSLVETLPAIVYVAEPVPPYATIYVSPGIESLGFTLEEWLANPDSWIRILHPDDRAEVLRKTEEALAAGRENDFEYRVVAKDGSVRWLHDRGRFVFDKQDGPIRWQGVLLDITRLKRSEEERESLARKLAAVLARSDAMESFLRICPSCERERPEREYQEAVKTLAARALEGIGPCLECRAGGEPRDSRDR